MKSEGSVHQGTWREGGREGGRERIEKRVCVWGVRVLGGRGGQGADASSMCGIHLLEHRPLLTSSPLAHAFSAIINATTIRVSVSASEMTSRQKGISPE